MIGSVRVLCVCTHNRTRSVMTGALLDDHLARLGVDAVVQTAGTYESGHPAMDRAVRLLADRGIDVRTHRSRRITHEVIAGHDLVVTAEREHVVWIAGQWPQTFRRTFTLPEAVDRAIAAAPGDVTIDEWLATVGADRPTALDYLDDDAIGELPDPTGHAPSVWEASFRQIDELTRRLAESLAGKDPRW